MVKTYRVVWEIDVTETSARRAAFKARKIQRMMDNWSGVFMVSEWKNGRPRSRQYTLIDLDDKAR